MMRAVCVNATQPGHLSKSPFPRTGTMAVSLTYFRA